MIKSISAFLAVFLILSGCDDYSNIKASDYPDAEKMVVSFEWPEGYGECFDKNNPELKIINVPEDTTHFKVKVIDIQNNDYDHGGGTVSNNGTGSIPYGSLSRYVGPCPSQSPTGSSNYQFIVFAYKSDDEVVGKGIVNKIFP